MFLMLSILFCQTHRVSLNLNQANVQKYPFINFQKTTTSKELNSPLLIFAVPFGWDRASISRV